MNGRTLTDTQISKALRAHLPDRVPTGLRERILASTETTSQQRTLPSFLGALSEADPVARRRSLLIAAALLVALAVASSAAVGAWRLLQRDPIDELSLEPPADLPAFVLSSYERLPELPPVELAWHDSGSAKGRVYVDRSGTVRFDRFTSADATEPSSSTIVSPNHRISGMALVESEGVWIEQGDEAIEDDPRVFIRQILNAGSAPDVLGCEVQRDPSTVGNGTAATGWRYVSLEYVAGRPTHHVACVGELSLDIDIWLDIQTGLILRKREPLADDAGQPIAGQFTTTEVTEIAFGEQPAALFEPPEGITRMSPEAYGAYLCTRDLSNEEVVGLGAREECPTPEAEATPLPAATPMPTVHPNASDCAVPSRDTSEPTGPLAWTEASLQQDWPAPVRLEPVGGANVLPMPPTYIDPSGDTGSDVLPCIDIRDLTVGTYDVDLYLVSNRPPDTDPSKVWIAYGVVIDEDRDGVPDWRYGIDNLPRTAGDEAGHHREWRTNLHTGRTESVAGFDWASVSDTYFDTGYPAEGGREGFHFSGDSARFRFGHVSDTTGGTITRGIKLDMPVYAWASMIVDGRVVATDYAPDAGWLLPSPGPKPGGTYALERGTYTEGGLLPFRLSMTVPDGWTAHGASVGDDGDDGTGLDLMIIDKPGLDACGSGGTALATIGPSADDLAAFLADQPKIKVSQSSDLTLDGYRGRYVEYTTTDSDDCDPDSRPFWPVISNHDGTREYNQTWILDVDGVRLVIDGFAPNASDSVKAELRQIVESIHIGP